jgi:hypothetical protein
MTPEQHAQHIRQLEFKLYKADYGMGMPRDYQYVLELRVMLNEAIKNYANALIAEGAALANLKRFDEDREALDDVARYEEREGGY